MICILIRQKIRVIIAYIERITVHDEHFVVEFKSGIEIEVKM